MRDPSISEHHVYKSSNNRFSAAARDISVGFSRWRLWTALAWEDLRQRFRRSYIGLLWTTISFAVFLAVKIIIFGPISGTDMEYYTLYLTLGFFAWLFLNIAVVESCAVFISAENWIKSARLPLTIFILQTITRNIILTFFNFIVVVAILAMYKFQFTWHALLSIPVIFIYCVNTFWFSIVMGTITARHRDVLHLVQTIMRVMFFLTPILWLPEQLGQLWTYLKYNPLAHFVIALRSPVLDHEIPIVSFIVVGVITVLGLILSAFMLVLARKKVVYWL